MSSFLLGLLKHQEFVCNTDYLWNFQKKIAAKRKYKF